MKRTFLFSVLTIFSMGIGYSSRAGETNPQVGEAVDVAAIGHLCTWTGTTATDIRRHAAKSQALPDGRNAFAPGEASPGEQPHIGIEWDFPQDVAVVEVEFLRTDDASLPGENALEYWHDSWPPEDRGGWTRIDDPFNGEWKRPKAAFERTGNRWVHRMLPLETGEISDTRGATGSHRRTYKIRLVFPEGRFPPVTTIRAFSPHNWKRADLKVEVVSRRRDDSLRLTSASVFCGHLISPLRPARTGDRVVRYFLGVLYSDCPDDSPDRTIVTLHWGKEDGEGVSFLPVQAMREGVFIPDFGLWITEEKGKSFGETEFARQADDASTIWQKVAKEPEQTYERARAEIPRLRNTAHRPYGSYTPLGCDGNRQEFGILYNGNVFCEKGAVKSPGREDSRMLWPGYDILYKIGTGDAPDFREREGATKQSLLDGYLPVVFSEWEKDGVHFRETAVASLLAPANADPMRLRGDETSVLILSLDAENRSDRSLPARVWFATSVSETLSVSDGIVHGVLRADKGEAQPGIALRCLVETRGRDKESSWKVCASDVSEANSVAFEIELPPRSERAIIFKIPFVSLLSEEELSGIRSLDFDEEVRGSAGYWRTEIDAGAKIRVPNQLLNDFIRAQLWHIAITADKDVDTGLMMLPAATFHYKVCANEACHQIRSLDLRGRGDLAEKYLEPFIRLQGTRPLHGRFSSSEGVFHGLRVKEGVDYQTFNYNLDHGFVLWMLCEHFRLTGDRLWLERVAPNIVAGCDFIVRERQATKVTDADGRKVWQYGLLPPGHLEDNPEFFHWYAVNAYASRGMMDAADVLSEIKAPDADRIRREAEEYLADIRRAARRSMLLSPVVNQGDGTYVPFQPTRCLLRGRDLGWIRDSLYGPIHLIDCGIYPLHSAEATWILQDAENSVFVSRERGLGIDTEKWWFSHGGMTLQPNLVPTPILYVKRDEAERAIRCLYNTLAASVYEDVRAFCEWLPARFGRGGGPFYKTPDESAFVVWLRYLLVAEDDDKLTLCPAAPREWFADGKEIVVQDLPTYFGEVSFRIVSHLQKGEIRAHIVPPNRCAPKELRLHVRHPQQQPIREISINGRAYFHFDAPMEEVFLPVTEGALDVAVRY
jgi:hypothetical protein